MSETLIGYGRPITDTMGSMAYHEMRLIMANVLYNFDMEMCPESEGWMEQPAWTLWEKRSLMVKLKDANAS